MNTENWNPIRSKWAGECGQIFAQVVVFAVQNAIDAVPNSQTVSLPLTQVKIREALGDISFAGQTMKKEQKRII